VVEKFERILDFATKNLLRSEISKVPSFFEGKREMGAIENINR